MKWYNIELDTKEESEKFKKFLKENKISYEPSECFNITHFEILLDYFSMLFVVDWLKENIGE